MPTAHVTRSCVAVLLAGAALLGSFTFASSASAIAIAPGPSVVTPNGAGVLAGAVLTVDESSLSMDPHFV